MLLRNARQRAVDYLGLASRNLKSEPMKKSKVLLLAAVCCFAAPLEGFGEISFTFNFSDPAGSGFNDNALGATRRGALQSAALTLGSYFANTGTLTLDVTSIVDVNSTTLADAGSSYPTAPAGFYRSLAQDEAILSPGYVSNGAASDGVVNWNFGPVWDFDDQIDPAAFDFKSTAIHELCHALGFLSLVDQGQNNTPKAYSEFDRFLTDSAGTPLINPTTFAFTADPNVIVGGSISGVRFNGPNTSNVRLFSRNPYEVGSNTSHLDDDFYTTQSLLMEAATLMGPGVRTFGALEEAMFRDLGYTLVPEPAAAVFLAFGSLVLAFRRTRERLS